MVVRGHVQNGVVVLNDGIRLQEGQEVTVLAMPQSASQGHGILDIQPVSLGVLMVGHTTEDDLLDEMLEGRQ